MIKNTEKKIDLHMHSTASDGLYSPSELIKLASKSGLSAVALTDHETTSGFEEAREAGLTFGVEVVCGVEISVGYDGKELHILGYMPEPKQKLDEILYKLREGRFDRLEKMLFNLGKLSIKISKEDIEKEAGNAAPGRLHMARVLYKNGYVAEISEAFDRFLGKDKPAYIPRDKLKASEAIELFLEYGVVPVLAHPGITGEESQSLNELKKIGLMGIEVFHPQHTEGLTIFYKNLAVREGLLITGGSDYHGDSKLSCPYLGCVNLDYRYLEQIKDSWTLNDHN